MNYKLLVVPERDMGHESRAGVKDGKDEDDQVEAWCLPERKIAWH